MRKGNKIELIIGYGLMQKRISNNLINNYQFGTDLDNLIFFFFLEYNQQKLMNEANNVTIFVQVFGLLLTRLLFT